MTLLDRFMQVTLTLVPRSVLWTVARRYVAGSELSDALARIAVLKADGYGTILDVLGEAVPDVAAARAAADEYHQALGELAAVDADATVSVKPTHLGLTLDQDLCEQLLADLARAAAARGARVRFEMENAPTIDGTLEVFRRVRARYDNVGCVIQARLFRSADDVAGLVREIPGVDVRLVKGIYLEPASIAWTEAEDISRSYESLAGALARGGARLALATHDLPLAEACAAHVVGREGPGYEFQLLMGVRRDVAEALRAAGHPVRIYVPYGRDWHAYSLRRLKHNPQVARQILGAIFRR